MKTLLTVFVVTFAVLHASAQNLVTGDDTEKYIRPAGNAVNFYLFNFMDYVGYTGADKQINVIADGNASHFRMPNVNYRVRLATDVALGNARRRHGIGISGDFRAFGGDYTGGIQVSYAFQVVDKPKVQFRIGVMMGVEFLKHNLYDATYRDMIDDRYGFVYSTNDPLREDSTLFVYPRSGAGAWLRVHGFGLAINADRLLPVNTGIATNFRPPVRLSGHAYYQIPIKRVHLMPVVSFLYDGTGYRVEGGVNFYMNPENGFFAGVFGSTDKDVRLLAGYNVKGRLKLLAGVTLYFEGLAAILPVYNGFGGMNLNFVRYGR